MASFRPIALLLFMLVLGIESSCDETAAAVLADGRRVLSSVVASQEALHAPYGGVVPELASRRHLEVIVPVVERALAEANIGLADLDGIVVTQGPGLVGSLLVGCSMAKALAYVADRPLVGVNHLEGHIYAAFLTDDPPEHPFLALVVSGGHTALYHAGAPLTYRLVGSLLVGCSMAKALAYVADRPLVGVNHLEGHIYAAFLTDDPPEHPFLALVVSGGHTALYHAGAPLTYRLVGETRDDAAGEAFDKVAKLLGLGFPGGPVIERVAREGDPKAIAFPLAQMSDGTRDFSFSGIKTSVSQRVKRHGPLSAAEVADVAASFQAAVVKMLVRKTVRAALHLGVKRVVLTGGVAANGPLRAALQAEGAEHGLVLHIPPRALCTDNAAMITAAGTARLVAGERADLTMNALPDLALAT